MGDLPNIIQEVGQREDSYFYHVNDGLHYHVHSETPTTIYFKCVHASCHGKALMRLNMAFQHTQHHNHPPNFYYTQVLDARRSIINQARSLTYVSFAEILATERRRIIDRFIRSELTLRRLRPAMQRARAEVFPTLPQRLADLTNILQDPAWTSISSTLDEQDSVYLGSTWAQDGSHNIVFISRRCLDLMKIVDTIFADGTFFIRPAVEGCYQVFTIVTIHGHTVIPLCWCLMESKTQHAYIAVLNLLRTNLVQWSFTTVVTDYEDAIINAFIIVFHITPQGCLFHSASAMIKQAKQTIGVVIISMWVEVKNVISLCCVLPLLPTYLLQRGLNAIGTEALNLNDPIFYEVVRPFLSYVQKEWLDHRNRGQCLSVCGSEHRTNNASESNNMRMRRKFGCHLPNVYTFLGKVVLFEDETVDDLCSLSRGIIPSRHRKSISISNDAYIQSITRDLLQIPDPTHEDLMVFLTSAARTVDVILNEALGISQEQFQLLYLNLIEYGGA